VLRAVVLTQYRRVTDGQTDGIAVASTALAMRALRRAVKTTLIIVDSCVRKSAEVTRDDVDISGQPQVIFPAARKKLNYYKVATFRSEQQ